MKKPILVVTSGFIKPIEARIEKEYEVRRKADGTLFTRDELLAASEGADAILITPFVRLDAHFFKHVSATVKVISTYSVGIDHIDMDGAAERNIAVGYTPGTSQCCCFSGRVGGHSKRRIWSEAVSGPFPARVLS